MASRERGIDGGARKTRRFPWRFLLQLAIVFGGPIIAQDLSSGPGGAWLGYGATCTVAAGAVLNLGVWRVHRAGDTVRGVLVGRHLEARADTGRHCHHQPRQHRKSQRKRTRLV